MGVQQQLESVQKKKEKLALNTKERVLTRQEGL